MVSVCQWGTAAIESEAEDSVTDVWWEVNGESDSSESDGHSDMQDDQSDL